MRRRLEPPVPDKKAGTVSTVSQMPISEASECLHYELLRFPWYHLNLTKDGQLLVFTVGDDGGHVPQHYRGYDVVVRQFRLPSPTRPIAETGFHKS